MGWYHAVSSNLTTCVETKEIIACLFVFCKECQEDCRCHCKTDKHLGGAGAWFHRALPLESSWWSLISPVPPALPSAMAQSPFYKSCHHLRQETGAQHCVVTKGRYHFKVSGSPLGSQATAVLDNTHTTGIPTFSHRPAETSWIQL